MTKPIETIKWHELEIGSIVVEPGNAKTYKTGTWRSERPVVDAEMCINCGVCWLFCPDICINQAPDGHFTANLQYCKGCGICAFECPVGCITMVKEEEE
jgi:pyruvate ferredoxin oxidoreductase delta subunit